MTCVIHRFLKDDCGATLPEYALLVALVVVGCLTSIDGLSAVVNSTFSTVAESMNSQPAGVDGPAPVPLAPMAPMQAPAYDPH